MKRGEWLFALALRLVPRPWRDTVRSDLLEEAQMQRRGALWRAWQALRAAARLRASFSGDAMNADIQNAIRVLRRSPGFAAGAVLTAGLGLGVSLALFTAVDRILFRPLPYTAPGELVLLRECSADGRCNGRFPSALAYEGARRLTTMGEMAVAGLSSTFELTPVPGESAALTFIGISPNLLRVLGVRPAFGRDVTVDEVQAKQPVVFISDAAWRTHFGADQSVIGRQMWQGTDAATIIGVLPAGFVQPGWVSAPVWHGFAIAYGGWSAIEPTGAINPPIARLRPGATLAAARAEVQALHQAIESAAPPRPATARPTTPVGIQVDRLDDALFSRFTDHLWLVVASAGLLATMAVINLAALLLARTRARERDTALRATLGASRARLVRASLIEAGLLAGMGAMAAAVALWGVQEWLVAALPPLFRQNFTFVTDARVLFFGAGAVVTCGLAAGLWPGLVAQRVGLLALLQQGAPAASRRLPGGPVILGAQAAVCVILVLGAGIMVRSFTRLAGEQLGFVPDDLYRLSVAARERPRGEGALQQYHALLDVVGRFPGVTGVAGADSVHTAPEPAHRGFQHGDVRGAMFEITAGYFRVLGSSLLAGREFTSDEIAARAPVAILSAGAVRELWPGRAAESVVGESISPLKGVTRQIVGVVEDLREYHGESPRPALFVPLGSAPAMYSSVLVRLAPGASPDLAGWRQHIERRIGPGTVRLAPAAAGTTALVDEPRFRALLLSTFGIAALLLAAAGLYAVTSLEVARRRTEIGVRLALGATKSSVLGGVVLSALRPVAIGCAIGVVLAYWLGAWAQTFLYHVDARDPVTMVLAVIVLVSAAALAAWLPARRAARTDPVGVLRAS